MLSLGLGIGSPRKDTVVFLCSRDGRTIAIPGIWGYFYSSCEKISHRLMCLNEPISGTNYLGKVVECWDIRSRHGP